MTSVPTPISEGYNVLVYIELKQLVSAGGGGTDYIAFRWSLAKFGSIAISGSTAAKHDGQYIGCADGISLSAALGKVTSADVVYPSVDFTIAREDVDRVGLTNTDVAKIRSYDYLVDCVAEIYQISDASPTPETSNLKFSGYIDRADVSIKNDSVTIRATSRLKHDDRRILKTTLDDDTYTTIADEWKNKKLPIIFGKFGYKKSGGPNSYEDYWVEMPVYMSDNSGSKNLLIYPSELGADGIGSPGDYFKWVDSDLKNKGALSESTAKLGWIYVDAVTGKLSVTGTASTLFQTLVDAGILATDDESYWEWRTGDKILGRRVQGIENSSNEVITEPIDLIEYLITDTIIGLGTPDINALSFGRARLKTVDYSFAARRHIVEDDLSIVDTVCEVCHDFLFKLVVDKGYYRLVWTGWNDLGAADYTLYSHNILDWTDTSDKEKEGIRALDLKYDYCPVTGEFTRRITYGNPEDTPAADVCKMECKWIFDEDDAQVVGALLLVARSGALRTLELDLDFNCLDLELGDVVDLNTLGAPMHSELAGTYQVIRYAKNYDEAKVKVTVIARNTAGICGVWSDDSGEIIPDEFGGGVVPSGPGYAYDYDNYSAANQAALSFWISDIDDYQKDDVIVGKVWCM